MHKTLLLGTIFFLLLACFSFSFGDLDPKSKEWKALAKKFANEWNSLEPNPQIALLNEIIDANNEPAAQIAVRVLLEEKLHPGVEDHIRRHFARLSSQEALEWITEEALVRGKLKKQERVRLINALAIFEGSKEETKKIIENGLLKVVNTGKDEEKVVAIEVLGLIKSSNAIPTLILQLETNEKNWSATAANIQAQSLIRDRRSVEPLINCLEKFTGRLQFDAERALEEITYQELGRDAKVWRSWWSRNSEKPFVRPQHKPMSSQVVKEDPTFYGIPIRSHNIVFICDVSISMGDPMPMNPNNKQPKYIVTGGGRQIQVDEVDWLDTSKIKNKLDYLKANMVYTLSQLKPETNFTLVSFHAVPEAWNKSLVQANPNNVAAAINEVRNWTFLNKPPPEPKKEKKPVSSKDHFRGLGETPVIHSNTNIYDAVALAYEIAKKTDADTFYLLSDGVSDCGTYVSQGTGIMYRKILEMNVGKKVTIHTIGIGSEHDQVFMRRLAEQTHGFYRNN